MNTTSENGNERVPQKIFGSKKLGEYVNSYKLNEKPISRQPKGLVNRGNSCFINAILQALVACSPFCHMLFGLARNMTSDGSRQPTPVIDGMCRFMKEFRYVSKNKKDSAVTFKIGTSLEPTWILQMLSGTTLVEGRQEDAEEFLSVLLNRLNDEMLEMMMKDVTEGAVSEKTPIEKIFGGLLKSRIIREGDTSTDNVQPFLTLQLDIRGVKTVMEALDKLAAKNKLEGLTSSRTNEKIVAWQQISLEELPVILALHVKCSSFRQNRCSKIPKPLEFPVDLDIDSKLLTSEVESPRYRLSAVVHHDGTDASRGHYFADVFHVGYGCRLRCDDACVKKVTEQQVLKSVPLQGSRFPYLLFYTERNEVIKISTSGDENNDY